MLTSPKLTLASLPIVSSHQVAPHARPQSSAKLPVVPCQLPHAIWQQNYIWQQNARNLEAHLTELPCQLVGVIWKARSDAAPSRTR